MSTLRRALGGGRNVVHIRTMPVVQLDALNFWSKKRAQMLNARLRSRLSRHSTGPFRSMWDLS